MNRLLPYIILLIVACSFGCGNHEINLLIDSGSKLNILDEADYDKLEPKPTLTCSMTKIFGYDSHKPLKVLGTFKTVIGALDNNTAAKFHVVKGNGGSLLGKPSATDLNLLRVGPPVAEHIAPVNFQSPQLQKILEENKDVFSGVCRQVEEFPAETTCKQNSHPNKNKNKNKNKNNLFRPK